MAASPLKAQLDLSKVTLGGGMRGSFVHTDPDGGTSTDSFTFNSARFYVNGAATEKIKFTLNTEYEGGTNKIGVLDAVARFEMSPKFNLWFGRTLPPSDRANLTGPYYANHWNVYTDGIQDGYNMIFQGRDNGVVYWGDFKKVVVSIGGFDGASLGTGSSSLLGAARVQIDLWDPEGGYYQNATYYGAKNLLALGVASQLQDGKTATTIDFLMEKKVPGGGAFTIESEYSNYNGLGGYLGGYKSRGEYGLVSFLFPKPVGMGKIQILGKYAKADFVHGPAPSFNQKTTEINVNYIIKEFNARVMNFYKDTRYSNATPDFWQIGVGLQIQM